MDLKFLGTVVIPFVGGGIGKSVNVEWDQEVVDIGRYRVLYTRNSRPGARRYHRWFVPCATACAT